MKHRTSLALGLVGMLGMLAAGAHIMAGPAAPKAGQGFGPPEVLRYRIRWRSLEAGQATLSVRGPVQFRGRQCLLFESTARTTRAFDRIFRVRDRIRSYWDMRRRRVLFSEKLLREGRYRRLSVTTFDYARGLARWREREYSGNRGALSRLRKPVRWRKRSGSVKIGKRALDVLSAVYFSRVDPRRPRPGQVFAIPIIDDGKPGVMRMHYLGQRTLPVRLQGRTVRLPAMLFEPRYSSSGLFKKRGRVRVWISDDRRRWPLRVTARVPVLGSVRVELVGVSQR